MRDSADKEPKIRLQISCPTTKVYKAVLLRKFFYMIFINPDGKTIHTYLATVFGGLPNEESKKNNEHGENSSASSEKVEDTLNLLMPVKHNSNEASRCHIKFRYDDGESGSELIKDIKFEDVTESFCNQIASYDFWGSTEIIENQNDLAKVLSKIYDDKCNNEKDSDFPFNKNEKIYYIHQDNKNNLFSCLATTGRFEDKDKDKNAYELHDFEENVDIHGIETVNWIKTIIYLNEDIRGKNLQFILDFKKDCDFYTTDFTWYFAPPVGYIIDENAYWDSKTLGQTRNILQSLSNATTVKFGEWLDSPESIKERTKSRLSMNVIPESSRLRLSDEDSLKITIKVINPNMYSNLQFFYGLFVAFILTFCSDKTRINDYYNCLRTYCHCGCIDCFCQTMCNILSVFLPILVIMSAVAKFCKKMDEVKSKASSIFYKLGVFSTFLIISYVFIAWSFIPGIMLQYVSCELNRIVIITLGVVGFFTNFIYLFYYLKIYKHNIADCMR